LRGCQFWLATQNGPREAQLLIEYIRVLAHYLQRRGLQAELLSWCEAGLRASESLQQNPGWLLLLCGQAQNALGRWDEATASFQAAIKASEEADPHTHAQATLALGRLQFNQGNYGIAFETMNSAETGLSQEAYDERLITVLG